MIDKNIDLLELFSGIGGFAKGLSQAGFNIKKHYFSEIDKHAIANYKHNFKKSEYVGSVVDVSGIKADIITFGSPCQDFSLAGKRTGMDGKRSVLILEAIRIISESKPSVFIWENVKGAFSSNDGADFWAIISAFANIGGYRLEWQLLNTSWFLPQNRERIYLVGHLDGRSEPGVFPIGETSSIHNRSRKAKKKIHSDNRIALTQQARQYASWNGDLIKIGTWRTHKDGQGFREVKGGNCPTIPARAREDGSGQPVIKVKSVATPNRKEKSQNGSRFKEGDSFTLCSQEAHGVQIDNTIRRLTEIECERLQGFPDDWTKYGNYDGETKEISKTQRYKMCGNAVTVDVVECIGKKLLTQ
jgi:DNA (cytosine-5)-methyltransferase 1